MRMRGKKDSSNERKKREYYHMSDRRTRHRRSAPQRGNDKNMKRMANNFIHGRLKRPRANEMIE